MLNDSAIRIFVAIMLGIMLIAAGTTGRPGSIIGSLVDAENMVSS